METIDKLCIDIIKGDVQEIGAAAAQALDRLHAAQSVLKNEIVFDDDSRYYELRNIAVLVSDALRIALDGDFDIIADHISNARANLCGIIKRNEANSDGEEVSGDGNEER